ncbi:MAG: hypothetical protein H0X26_04270 [Alphaproteobacteria bacterium]|nr:hypothetical protein [Alphaproteobacteria bacterium]
MTVTIIGILLPSVLLSFLPKIGNTTHSVSQQSTFVTSSDKSNTSIDANPKYSTNAHSFESVLDDSPMRGTPTSLLKRRSTS